MTGRRISIVATAAAVASCAVLHAAEKLEKLELRGSTEAVLPTPRRTIDTDRRMYDQAERPTVDGGVSAPARNNNSPLLNKKVRREVDNEKNWIFLNPREDHFDSKTKEFMDGEKSTGLYSNRFMKDDDDRTAVQRFLEKDRDREDKDKDNDKENDSDRAREKESFLPKHDDDELKENSAQGGIPKAQFDTAIFKAGSSADPFGGNPLDNKIQRNPFSESNFSPQRSRALDKDELRQQQIAHEQEFNNILQARPGSTASFGKIDNLNPAADVGRLDIGGTTTTPGRRSDPYSIGGRGGPTTVTFTDGGASPFGNRGEMSARSFSDSLPAFGAPKAGPSFAPGSAQITPNRVSTPPPSVAPTVPMRKF